MNNKESLTLLNWTFDESEKCKAQGIITNGTENIWISCTSYIAHGTIQFNKNGVPIGVLFHHFNYDALDGPVQQTGDTYRHISDGDYGNGQLWFGIEGGSFPRILTGAIVRYDADTLQFIDIHKHSTFKTMPWLVFDRKNQRAISCNWTNSNNEFIVFDARTLTWIDSIKLYNVPGEYEVEGIPFIQGGAMLQNEDSILLQVDNQVSTIFLASLFPDRAVVTDAWSTGLGQEREGVSMVGNYILSLGNRKNSFENISNAQIIAVPMHTQNSNIIFRSVTFGIGVVVGIVISFIWLQLLRFWHRKTNFRRDYGDVEVTNLSLDDTGDGRLT
jgi:hypothetical protein